MSLQWVVSMRARSGPLLLLVTSSALAILAGACGPGGVGDEKRPRAGGVLRDSNACVGRDLIKGYLESEVDEAAIQIAALVDPATGEGDYQKYEKYDSVIAALVDCRELKLLLAVVGKLPIGPPGAIRRRRLFHAMGRWDRVDEFRPTLERLASQYPEDLNLAPFRRGGIEYLLATLEDTHASPNHRAYSAKVLAVYGTEAVIPRLERLVGDGSILQPPMGPPGKPDTVGSVVRHAIESIERRVKDSGSK